MLVRDHGYSFDTLEMGGVPRDHGFIVYEGRRSDLYVCRLDLLTAADKGGTDLSSLHRTVRTERDSANVRKKTSNGIPFPLRAIREMNSFR